MLKEAIAKVNFSNGAILIVLVAINFLVKGMFIDYHSLGGDEPFSVYHAQMDIPSIIDLLTKGNNPPLYEILLHWWIKLGGISTLSVRFPSLIASCVTLIYIYKLGESIANSRVAIIASVIFIFSNYHLLFAHEARVYAIFGMLSSMSMCYFYQLFLIVTNTAPKSTKTLFFYVFSSVFLIYAHYFGFFVLFAQGLFLLLFIKKILHWRILLSVLAVLLALYLPNLFTLYQRLNESIEGTWVSPPNGIDDLYNMIRHFTNAPVVTGTIILLLLASGVKVWLTRQKTQTNQGKLLIVVWFFSIFFAMFAISYQLPMFLDRYLMPASIAFIVLVSIAVDFLSLKAKYSWVLPVITIGLFVTTVKPAISNKRNVKEAVQFVKDWKDEKTLVLFSPTNFILDFSYYYDRNVFQTIDTTANYSKLQSMLGKESIVGVNSIEEVAIDSWKRIVYLDAAADFNNPTNGINARLEESFTLKTTQNVYEIYTIKEYVKDE